MSKLKLLILTLFLASVFYDCKKSETTNDTIASQSDTSRIQQRQYKEVGDVPMAQEEEPAFRPTLPLEQAAFKGSTAEEQKRLENEFAFMFEKTWVVNGRVRAGDDKPQENKHEIYKFQKDGSYTFSMVGQEGKGTWKGWMNDQVPVMTIFPLDLKEKVSEWNVKNTGKTMIWSGTSSYKDNPFMIQFVIK